MSEPQNTRAGGLRLRLPATSANLGPGFDAAAIALDFHLEIEAEAAAEFSIVATGLNADRCARLENNLVIETYRKILVGAKRPVKPLAIRMHNGIPLAMGCGSSAAGRLAAIAMAVHFGELGWDTARILYEAYLLEGHPDNIAACWLGGFVAAACKDNTVHVARVIPPEEWRAIVVLPADSLATSKARAVLPASYSLEDVVANIQAVSMLASAFAQARKDLLGVAMTDRIHQPYRAPICTLLPKVLPLVGRNGIIGAALSGAGPAVLVIIENENAFEKASGAILDAVSQQVKLQPCRFVHTGTNLDSAASRR
jgi:homoserine kinase